ncbi:hypothetical protein H4S08_000894 [Coemansia sp. RSA 1365]|nr:hypothetical protein H4S08_000894 [Coemansia sp. RSA 1365]
MLRHVYQAGILTIFNSASSKPLQLWCISAKSKGLVELEDDDETDCPVLRLESAELASTFISLPRQTTQTLGVKLPYMVMIVKNTDHFFSFEVEIVDNQEQVRRIRTANYEADSRIDYDVSCLPLRLDCGWNYLTLDLGRMTSRIYGTVFKEVCRVTVHASACLRLIFFADRIVPENQLPVELRLYGKKES